LLLLRWLDCVCLCVWGQYLDFVGVDNNKRSGVTLFSTPYSITSPGAQPPPPTPVGDAAPFKILGEDEADQGA